MAMAYRSLGKTGLTVSEIGFGAWGIGGATPGMTSYGTTDDAVSRRALAAAYDAGITLFDTSSVYGDGHSEELIGAEFASRRDRVVIATKAGLLRFHEPPDFSPEALRRSVEGSLRRLGTDYIDLLQLHNPPVEDGALLDGALETLDRLRREGSVRAVGFSLKTPDQGLAAIAEFGCAVVQFNLNMLDWRAVDCGLFELATTREIGVIVRTPLCFGFLSGNIRADTVFAADDHRNRWPRSQIAAWVAAADEMAAAVSLEEALSRTALRFCLSWPAVSTVIPGILTEAEANENAAASAAGSLPADSLSTIKAIYRRLDHSVSRSYV